MRLRQKRQQWKMIWQRTAPYLFATNVVEWYSWAVWMICIITGALLIIPGRVRMMYTPAEVHKFVRAVGILIPSAVENITVWNGTAVVPRAIIMYARVLSGLRMKSRGGDNACL